MSYPYESTEYCNLQVLLSHKKITLARLACLCFVCSVRFLFAAFRLFAVGIFYLQRSFLFAAYFFLFAAYFFYLQRTFFICSVPFFVCSVSFLFAAFLFCLQRFFFVCSVSFLFAAFLFFCSVFFFVCSVSLVGHRIYGTHNVETTPKVRETCLNVPNFKLQEHNVKESCYVSRYLVCIFPKILLL